MSGFTGAGYPKAVPSALGAPHRAAKTPQATPFASACGRAPRRRRNSTAPWPRWTASKCACPTSPTPPAAPRSTADTCSTWTSTCRTWRNSLWFGFLGKLDVAVVEVAGVLPDGRLIPSSSIGNNKTWLDQADKGDPRGETRGTTPGLEGMHDIYYGTDVPPNRKPIQMTEPHQRIGEPYLRCDPGQGDCGGEDPPARPQFGVCRARRYFGAHRRPHHRILPPGSEAGALAQGPPAAAVGRGATSPTRCWPASTPGRSRTSRPTRRYCRTACWTCCAQASWPAHRPTALSLSPSAMQDFNDHIDYYQRAHRAAPPGNQQPPRADTPHGPDCDERHDRGRHLRQRETRRT